MEKITQFKSVVLTSDDPDRTASFYRDVLELPIAPERHRGTLRHHAGRLGAMHFAVHPREGFWLPGPAADTIVSFTVDVEAFAPRLSAHAVPIVARTQIGPMQFAAVRDPDGRYVCLGSPWPT